MYFLYNVLLMLAAVFAGPYYGFKMLFAGKYRKSLGPKLGMIPEETYAAMRGSPRIWIHAVSVGEVTAAAPILSSIREQLPEACLVLSTSTETGQDMARRLVKGATAVIYYPLDIPWTVRKVLDHIKPDLFVPVETEIWPNFMRACREMGVRIILVNGRLSPRSFHRYAATRFFWKQIIRWFDAICVISEVDAQRARKLGMPQDRIHVFGNAKYDGLASQARPALQDEMASRLPIRPGEPVLVAGSTHEGEEKLVLHVYRKLLKREPLFKLILVPRHIERSQSVLRIVREEGFEDCVTLSEINGGRGYNDERIILVDVIGELFKLYSLATVVFCGGSLVPKGGQNILEPAAWGKVVFYGPSMEDFSQERAILEGVGAGIMIQNEQGLYEGIMSLIRNPGEMRDRGQKGREAVAANMGASVRYAEMVRLLISRPV
jgi:3-deoxy-D-manno-octulosonic-acid transferase